MKLKYSLPIALIACIVLFSFYLDRRQLESGILVCANPLGNKPIALGLNERISGLLEIFEKTLADSSEVDNRVALSVFSSSYRRGESAVDALSTLSQENPQNQFAAVQLLNACTKEEEHPACNNETLNRAILLDGDNGALWALVASVRYAQLDNYGAMVALEAAIEAPEYNDYFQAGLQIVIEALPEIDDESAIHLYSTATSHGIALAINNYSALRPILEMCSANLLENQRLGNACLGMGNNVEQQSSSLLGSGMGNAIQSTTYRALGDMAEFQRMEDEASLGQNYQFTNDAQLAHRLMEHDSQLARYWVDEIIRSGEQAAIDSIAIEAKRLSSQWNYNPCPGVLFGNVLFAAKDFSRWVLSQEKS